MDDQRAQGSERLRRALNDAESSARRATEALLGDLAPVDGDVRQAVEDLRDYCRSCRDPFLALDIARLLRALVDDLDASAYAEGPVTEWAHAELRVQALASRVARSLRDQGALHLEQCVVDLSILHLRALEEGPRYVEILGAMAELLDASEHRTPVTLVEEFFGLARRAHSLPTSDAPG